MHTADKIIADIRSHMIRCGVDVWNEVYVGVTSDAMERLFSGHRVMKIGDRWIYRQATSSSDARAAESYFHNKLGADGGPGGGDDSADYVYAYWKGDHTNP